MCLLKDSSASSQGKGSFSGTSLESHFDQTPIIEKAKSWNWPQATGFFLAWIWFFAASFFFFSKSDQLALRLSGTKTFNKICEN